MQVKSGGFMHNGSQQVQQTQLPAMAGTAPFGAALRPTEQIRGSNSAMQLNQNIDFERFDSEKHSVRNLVEHFSKFVPPSSLDGPLMHLQNKQDGSAPPLSYLHQQAKTRQSQKQQWSQNQEAGDAEVNQILNYQRQTAMKEYLSFDSVDSKRNQTGGNIIDPSAILGGNNASLTATTAVSSSQNIRSSSKITKLRSTSASPSILFRNSRIKPPTPKPFIPFDSRGQAIPSPVSVVNRPPSVPAHDRKLTQRSRPSSVHANPYPKSQAINEQQARPNSMNAKPYPSRDEDVSRSSYGDQAQHTREVGNVESTRRQELDSPSQHSQPDSQDSSQTENLWTAKVEVRSSSMMGNPYPSAAEVNTHLLHMESRPASMIANPYSQSQLHQMQFQQEQQQVAQSKQTYLQSMMADLQSPLPPMEPIPRNVVGQLVPESQHSSFGTFTRAAHGQTQAEHKFEQYLQRQQQQGDFTSTFQEDSSKVVYADEDMAITKISSEQASGETSQPPETAAAGLPLNKEGSWSSGMTEAEAAETYCAMTSYHQASFQISSSPSQLGPPSNESVSARWLAVA